MPTRRLLMLAMSCLIATTFTLNQLAAQTSGPITFTGRASPPLSGSIAIGDFDRDGRPDIASIGFTDHAVLVIYRSGTGGSLAKKAEYPIDTGADGAWVYSAGDLNEDGRIDLVISKEFRPELEIWYGNGDATFRFGQVLGTSFPSRQVGIGDVNRDGTIDIVTSEPDDTSSGSGIYLNDGFANFTLRSFVEAGSFVLNFALADFNRDGWLDILYRTRKEFVLFAGRFDGFVLSRRTALPFTEENNSGTMTVGSFNRDTALDIAYRIACPECSATIHVFLNNGSGTFSRRAIIATGTPNNGGEEIAAGDLNLDGVMDIVFPRNFQASPASSRTIAYLLNHGDGTFTGPFVAANRDAALPVLRRFTLDSRMDIMLPSSAGVVTLLATSGPTNCTPPGTASLRVKICTPGNNATVRTTFTVRAAGDSPAGVSRMMLFVDGVKKHDLWSDQLARSITVAPGRHRITVRAQDRYIGDTQTTIFVTAQ